jgi:hypothetical protein
VNRNTSIIVYFLDKCDLHVLINCDCAPTGIMIDICNFGLILIDYVLSGVPTAERTTIGRGSARTRPSSPTPSGATTAGAWATLPPIVGTAAVAAATPTARLTWSTCR